MRETHEERFISLELAEKIYIAEDDYKLAELLSHQLMQFGFKTQVAMAFQRIDEEVKDYEPHLILLDINLPFFDGFYWCRRIRLFSKTPIVFLSGRTGDMDKVLALDHGGDDYLTKPFHPEVLLAKVRALLRRTYGEYAAGRVSPRDEIVKNGLIVDTRHGQVYYQDEMQQFTTTELELLRVLLEVDGQTVTRDQLLTAVWDDVQFIDDNTLTVNMTRLRSKPAKIGLFNVISTVRGVGYCFSWPKPNEDGVRGR